jgi:hemoglobin/transferrin/lactoferrin receptor protein
VNEHFTAELDGTNLTDRYYADPLTRSLNPAPGRTAPEPDSQTLMMRI